MTHRKLGAIAFAAYAGTVLLANWLVAHFGVVTVAPGLRAPAAVYAVGAALLLRDVVQTELGVWAAGAAICVGTALSFAVSPTFAIASGAAFAVSETADLAVFTPLRSRWRHGTGGWLAAAAASNVVGAVIDSLVFLSLAFHSLDFLPGQVVGKLAVTVVTLAAVAAWKGRRAVLVGRP